MVCDLKHSCYGFFSSFLCFFFLFLGGGASAVVVVIFVEPIHVFIFFALPFLLFDFPCFILLAFLVFSSASSLHLGVGFP